MCLLNTEVMIGINSSNVKYYENLGYIIPKHLDSHKKMRYKNGTKINVKIDDLQHGSGVKLDAMCDNCRKEYIISYNNYVRSNHNGKTYCRLCAIKLFNTAENSSSYKKYITKEERELKRNYQEYHDFVKRVLNRDNFTCKCCGKSKQYMEVHHLDGYNWCIEKRTNETNGITLCKKCHSNFHAIYGNGDNTKEQFYQWIGEKKIELEKFNGDISSARKIYAYEEDKIYNSATDFIKEHNLKATSTVFFVCNHQYYCKTIKKIHLFWYDEYIKMSKENILKIVTESQYSNSKKVICLTTNRVYDSIAKGAIGENASKTSITRCCMNKTKQVLTKDGLITKWKFYDEK